MAIWVTAATLCGRRNENQDHLLAGNHLMEGDMALQATAPPGETLLLGVADGIGGGVHPKEASRAALEALEGAFWAEGARSLPLVLRLLQAAAAANQRVWQLCLRYGGCTLACAAISPDGEFATLAVGDSSIFLSTHGEMRQLFTPQNEAAQKAALGLPVLQGDGRILTAFCGMDSDAASVPFRCTSCGRLHPGERLVLHSDGLTLAPAALHRAIEKKTPAKALCRKALLQGSGDNITAVIALME
mgnify:FL=1